MVEGRASVGEARLLDDLHQREVLQDGTEEPLGPIAGSSGIKTWDRLDRQLAVKGLELFEVTFVLGTAGKSLEADDAAQAGYKSWSSANLGVDGFPGDSLIVQWGQAPPHDVDDPVAAAHTQVVGADNLFAIQRLAVEEAGRLGALQEPHNRFVTLATRPERVNPTPW